MHSDNPFENEVIDYFIPSISFKYCPKKRQQVYFRSFEASIVLTAVIVIVGILFQLVLIKMVQVYTREKRNFKYAFWTFFAGVELSLIPVVLFQMYFVLNPCYGQFGCGFGQAYALVVCLIVSAVLILLSLIFYLFEYYRTPTESQDDVKKWGMKIFITIFIAVMVIFFVLDYIISGQPFF